MLPSKPVLPSLCVVLAIALLTGSLFATWTTRWNGEGDWYETRPFAVSWCRLDRDHGRQLACDRLTEGDDDVRDPARMLGFVVGMLLVGCVGALVCDLTGRKRLSATLLKLFGALGLIGMIAFRPEHATVGPGYLLAVAALVIAVLGPARASGPAPIGADP